MKNLIKLIIKKDFYIFFFAIPSLIVGWLGLSRPYYSSPDQDFLWVSQSIRLFKGLGPSYADHPGAYWPLSFLIKFLIFSKGLVSEFIDQYGGLSVEIIDKIINISRIENALITASLPILFFLILKDQNVDKKITILATYSLCLSSATLYLVSDIRHENIGIFFMFLYILFTSREINKSKKTYFFNINAIINTLFFYAAIFCKQQILLLYPLTLLFILNCLKNKNLDYYEKFKTFIKRDNILNLLFLFSLSGIPWIIISIEEFYKFGIIFFINLPFWSFINSGLIFSMIISAKDKITKLSFIKYFFILTPIQIIIFEILSPNVWRRSITAFPSFLLPFSSLSDGNINLYIRLKDFLTLIKDFSISLSWPGIFIFSLSCLCIIYFFIRFLEFARNRRNLSLLDFFVLNFTILIGILSLRQQSFYQIYYFIPILFVLSLGYTNKNLNKEFFKQKFIINKLFFLTSTILLLSFCIKSTTNIFYLNKFISLSQSQELLCDSQTLDYSLKNTPSGICDLFEEESNKKNKFNSWW